MGRIIPCSIADVLTEKGLLDIFSQSNYQSEMEKLEGNNRLKDMF